MRFARGSNSLLSRIAPLLAAGALAVLVAVGTLTVLDAPSATADADTESAFALPEEGCPMAHCDPQMSDAARMYPPLGSPAVLWHRSELPGENAGSNYGLGCAGNGVVAACTFRGATDNLAVYDYQGNRLWTSGALLNGWAWTSAPMVDAAGGVIAADNVRIIRFDGDGDVLWNTMTPGGLPISPVITENGTIVLAAWNGPVSAYDAETGAKLAELWVREYPGDPGFFETVNTPAVRGNRVYVSMHHQADRVVDEDNLAWLVALDVDPTNPLPSERLRVAWHFTFGGPSGASPLVIDDTVYFDGDRTVPGTAPDPHAFAVRDDGDVGTEVWRAAMASSVMASFARDPRGGLWAFSSQQRWLIRLDENDGSELQRIDLDALVGTDPAVYYPSSAMTVTKPDYEPGMLLSAFAGNPSSTYVAAVGLASETLLWKVQVAGSADLKTAGQFPIVGHFQPRVVFSTYDDGVMAIGVDSAVGGIAELPLIEPLSEAGGAAESGSNSLMLTATAIGCVLLLAAGVCVTARHRLV